MLFIFSLDGLNSPAGRLWSESKEAAWDERNVEKYAVEVYRDVFLQTLRPLKKHVHNQREMVFKHSNASIWQSHKIRVGTRQILWFLVRMWQQRPAVFRFTRDSLWSSATFPLFASAWIRLRGNLNACIICRLFNHLSAQTGSLCLSECWRSSGDAGVKTSTAAFVKINDKIRRQGAECLPNLPISLFAPLYTPPPPPSPSTSVWTESAILLILQRFCLPFPP